MKKETKEDNIIKQLKKSKWPKTRKTMLTSVLNGELGFHTGSGFDHEKFTVGTIEELQHCYFNEGIDYALYLMKLFYKGL